MTDLEEKTYSLIRAFYQTQTCQRYIKAKKAYNEDREIQDLISKIKEGKKKVKYLPHSQQLELFSQLRIYQKMIDENSITITYKQLEEEIKAMEEPIRDLFVF